MNKPNYAIPAGLTTLLAIAGVGMDELIDKVIEPKCDVCKREVGSVNELFYIRGQFICGGCVMDKAAANSEQGANPQ